ncbi:MAG: photosystem II protein PsbQ [Cyanobacteria bacterium P01_A01_bin.84]
MARKRSIFSLILVILATLLISCSGPTVKTAPPTYTPLQLQKLQEYAPDLEAVRDRSAELESLISKRDWRRVSNFIHGPMAEARLTMNYVARNLLPQDQKTARNISRDVFNNLVKIDKAAESGDSIKALNSYSTVFTDIDQFLKLLPELPLQETPESSLSEVE